jgi:hypothetical protein
MALNITDTEITSDQSGARAEFRPHAAGGNGAWVVIYDDVLAPVPPYYGKWFDRNQAISALTIEEEKAGPAPDLALIASLESELC